MIDTQKLYRAATCVHIAVEKSVADDLSAMLKGAADEIADLRGILIRIRDGHPDIDNNDDYARWCRGMAMDAITRSIPAPTK